MKYSASDFNRLAQHFENEAHAFAGQCKTLLQEAAPLLRAAAADADRLREAETMMKHLYAVVGAGVLEIPAEVAAKERAAIRAWLLPREGEDDGCD